MDGSIGDDEDEKERKVRESRAHQFASRDPAGGGAVSDPTVNEGRRMYLCLAGNECGELESIHIKCGDLLEDEVTRKYREEASQTHFPR